MSKLVEAREVRPRDLFSLPNGSVYAMLAHARTTGAPQGRLWCAHPPDVVTFEPLLVDFLPEQQVHLLEGREMREHYHHEGFVQTAFTHEMDRRHQTAMKPATERWQRNLDEQRQHDRGLRPWWKKVFG